MPRAGRHKEATMRYKLLGNSGLRVSEFCLGTMTFGEDWGWGASREQSRAIFDCFVEAGGNFIDTASNYTDGSSEQFVGEFIRGDRERLVVATKYSLSTRRDDPNAGGNHRKNMVQSIERSLRRLGTEYIDLLWLHMWDYFTPVEEVMRAFDDLVRAGKVLYAGFSDTPAWVIARADMLATLRGWAPVTAVQLPYSLSTRDAERELLPMMRALGMTVTAWDVLDGGILTGKYSRAGEEPRRYERVPDRTRAIAEVVVEIAGEIERPPAQLAIAWVRRTGNNIIPILGARSAEQMAQNLGALDLELTCEQCDRLAEAAPIDIGFPHAFLTSDHVKTLIFGTTYPLVDVPATRPLP
jgi:aryl-alcohol dehydrogenase-like predicted oxidoreductase